MKDYTSTILRMAGNIAPAIVTLVEQRERDERMRVGDLRFPYEIPDSELIAEISVEIAQAILQKVLELPKDEIE